MQTIPCDEPNTFVDLSVTGDSRLCFSVRTPTGTSKVVLRRPKLSKLLATALEIEKAMLELEACEGI